MAKESNVLKVIDNQNSFDTTLNTSFSFSCPRSTDREVNGAFSPFNDAKDMGDIISEMYEEWYGVQPLTGKIIIKVHLGTDYDNACWYKGATYYGDGDQRFHALLSPAIVSHEVAHGVTEQSSGLIYSLQSGGMNEAFSDMAAKAAQWYNGSFTSTDHPEWNWYIFDKIVKDPIIFERNMEDPVVSHTDEYNDYVDVHLSSGIYNKAFQLISESPGFNPKIAFDIFYYANTLKWFANINFTQGADAVLDVAEDMLLNSMGPEYGFDVDRIREAFQQVGICCRPGRDCIFVRNGTVCTKNSTSCSPSPCLNDGTCTDLGYGLFECNCEHGFVRYTCLPNPCIPNTCPDDGECSVRDDGSRKCVCITGRFGDDCDQCGYHSGAVSLPVGPSNQSLTISNITINESCKIIDIDIILNVQHTYDEDLEIFLEHKELETEILLVFRAGGEWNNFQETILDQEATKDIQSGTAPFTGRYYPHGNLSTFYGKNSSGVWTLKILDTWNGDGGRLENWAILLRTDCDPYTIHLETLYLHSYRGLNNSNLGFTLLSTDACATVEECKEKCNYLLTCNYFVIDSAERNGYFYHIDDKIADRTETVEIHDPLTGYNRRC